MNELQRSHVQLPDSLEDLSRFVLVNEERIQALRAEIRAIQKVSLAREVYEQKLAEAQEIGQITVEAAQKMGELLLQIQKQSGGVNQYNKEEKSAFTEKSKTKAEVISEIGIERHAANDYQQMAQNPEAVQAAIQKAIERGDVVSRSQVMKEIRAVKEESERKIRELENRPPEVKEILKFPSDYEKLKSDVESSRKESQRITQEYREMAEKWRESEREKDALKKAWEKEKNDPAEGVKHSALMFCAGISKFIEDYGGYVWLTTELGKLPEKERIGFIQGINALDSWVQQMKQNMEGVITHE